MVGQTTARIVTVNGSAVLGGTVPVTSVQVVRIDAGAGDDTLRFDESHGAMPPGEFVGGEGRDFRSAGRRPTASSGAAGTGSIGSSAAPATTP